MQQQAAPVSSYYLLHGKYNAKGGKQKSASVKATDLGPAPQGQVQGKGSIMAMHQLQQQIGKPTPKSHSHGISTPTAINSLHVMSSTTPNQGSVLNVPKQLMQTTAEQQ